MTTTTETVELNLVKPQEAILADRQTRQSLELPQLDQKRLSAELPGPGPRNVTDVQETWYYPRLNTWRIAAIFFAFINFGMNDACYGALMPYVSIAEYFHSYSVPTDESR